MIGSEKTRLVAIDHESKALIWAARALVGSDLKLKADQLITVANGTIQKIETCSVDQLRQRQSREYRIFQFDDHYTLMPALIDAHLHLALRGSLLNGQNLEEITAGETLAERLNKKFGLLARMGIGLVRDGGDRQAVNFLARELAAGGSGWAPQVVATGMALRPADGYGSFLGPGYRSRQELKALIDQLADRNCDQIKVIISGVVNFNDYGQVSGQLLSAKALQYIVNEAREKGLRVMAHASSKRAVHLAINAGVDSIEHGYFIDKRALDLMVAQKIAWVPTVIPVAAQLKSLREKDAATEVAVIKRIYTEQLKMVHLAFQRGVTIGLGSDAGAPGVEYGSSLLGEIALFAESGLKPKSILKMVTANNATILGRADQAGAIARGRKPYLIALQGKLPQDLTALERVNCHFIPRS